LDLPSPLANLDQCISCILVEKESMYNPYYIIKFYVIQVSNGLSFQVKLIQIDTFLFLHIFLIHDSLKELT